MDYEIVNILSRWGIKEFGQNFVYHLNSMLQTNENVKVYLHKNEKMF